MKLTNPIIIFYFAAFAGIYQLLGVPGSFIKLAIFFLILMFSPFIYSFFSFNKKYTIKELVDLALLIVLPLFLVLFQNDFASTLSVFQALSPLGIIYLFSIFVASHSTNDIRKLMTLFLNIQFLASIIKYIIIGTQRRSWNWYYFSQAGSLSTFIVVLFVSFALGVRQTSQKIVLLLQALIFAYINEKRLGILIVALTCTIVSFQLKNKFKANSRLVYTIFGLIFSSFVSIILFNINSTILDGGTFLDFGDRCQFIYCRVQRMAFPLVVWPVLSGH